MRTKQAEPIPVVDGYEPEMKTISIMKANLISIPFMLVVGFLSIWIYYKVWHSFEWNGVQNALWLGVAIVVGIVVHELIHGFTWMVVTRQSFKHLSFGTMAGAVYCHIDVPMKKRPYIIGAVMPLLLLGADGNRHCAGKHLLARLWNYIHRVGYRRHNDNVENPP